MARGNLRASLSVEASDVFIIAVPTPVAEDRAPDISYVLQAARTVAPVLKNGDTVILESTSPVGTTEAVPPGKALPQICWPPILPPMLASRWPATCRCAPKLTRYTQWPRIRARSACLSSPAKASR